MTEHVERKSISKNTVFYMVNQALNAFFPFITSMYVARVLLTTASGQVSFAQNIASYFSILAFLGIPTYGIREIAKVRDDDCEKSRVYSELFLLNLVSTVIFLTIYIILIFMVERFYNDIFLFLITGLTIAFNAINNEWLFTGLEEFGFISIRSGVVKLLSFILLVIFVKAPKDYLLYAFISVIGTVGNYVINIFYSHNYVHFSFKEINLVRHLKPVLLLSAVNIAIELYSLVDVTMLGFLSSPDDVAFYSYGSRIIKVFLQCLNAITIVVVPRLTQFYKCAENDNFNSLLRKSFLTINLLSIPAFVGIIVISETAVRVFFGEAFIPSAWVLKLLSPIIVFTPLGYLLGSRVLLISNKENKMLMCVTLGAIINIVGNWIFIPRLSYIGASLVSTISEIIIMMIYLSLSKGLYCFKNTLLDFLKIIVGVAIMLITILSISFFIHNNLLLLLVQVFVGIIMYYFTELITREEIVKEYTKYITNFFLVKKG